VNPVGHVSLLALAVPWLTLSACNDKPAADLGFGVSFDCEADHEQSDALRLRILVGGCESDNEAIYNETIAKGLAAPAANNIAPGTYGIEGTALSGGEELAFGCLLAVLPTTQTLNVVLQSDSCDNERDGGGLDAGVTDAGDLDASDDAETDALIDEDAGDAERDAAPIPCTESCDDGVVCTDDSCDTTSGKCLHMPFSGARECDGIACTQADQCTDGTCKAGGANNLSCPDDGQVCTAEVCVVGVGCTHPTAEANDRTCNDDFNCTSSDKCTSGVCRGNSNCAAGFVCTVDGTCQATGCTISCDDNNPCTTDSCVGNVCTNAANSLTCIDGQSCTDPDVCSNKACVGTNTCVSGASCGGAICRCTSAGQTLCGDGCFNLTNNRAHCGSCGRDCGSAYSCENSACKPDASAPLGCTAHRYGGHDYLVCNNLQVWSEARKKCRSWNMGLAIIDNLAENQFVQARIGTAARWLGANDRGNSGNNCTKANEEGTWYWANANSEEDNGTQFCALADSSANSCTAYMGRYQNWKSGEPKNTGCNCAIPFICSATEGEDCGMMEADGTWNDSKCGDKDNPGNDRLGYVCESP